MSQTQTWHGQTFPTLILGEGLGEGLSLEAYICANKNTIDERLAQSGAVLFRGFGIDTADKLDAAVEAYGEPGFTYEKSLSNAVRVNLTPRVFTANEAPPDVSIYLHHEMAQTPLYPSKLFFACLQAAETGGATPICRSDIVLEKIRLELPEIATAFLQKGVTYTNVMPPEDDPESGQGRSWRSTLSVDSREEAEVRLSDLGYRWDWLDGDVLKVMTPRLDAIRPLSDGSESFFNQLIAAFRGWKDARNDPSKSIRFGDGSVIDPEQMKAIIQIADDVTYDLNWQTGDVALLDNFRVMHGRRPYQGKRRVVASLIR